MLKLLVKSFIWLVLHVFYVLPINEHQVYFSSFFGRQFSCNTKYLYLYLLAHNSGSYSFVWEFDDVSKSSLVPDAAVVKAGSLRALIPCMTSKYLVFNAELPWYIPLRKSQVYLQTWHGGGAYKKLGLEANWGWKSDFEQKLCSRQVSYYVSSCKKLTEVLSVSKCVPVEKFLPCGQPRDAFLLSAGEDKKAEIKEKLGFDSSCHIVLYAPSYRGRPGFGKEEQAEYEKLDYKSLQAALVHKFGGNWKVLYRAHYYMASGVSEKNSDVLDMSQYDDIQELLLISDVLITDFSSSMWDFSLMSKPCFLYAPDIDSYDIERGFYTSPYFWPFPLAKNNQELFDSILGFDDKKYLADVNRHFDELGSYENKDACAKICKAIGLT